MAFHISVRVKQENGTFQEVYQNPLGTGTQLSTYWFGPAREIGLTFFDLHFDDHMEVSGHDLDLLESDLDLLQKHWQVADTGRDEEVQYVTTDEDGSREEGSIPMREHLQNRMGFLREALKLARQTGGVLSVS